MRRKNLLPILLSLIVATAIISQAQGQVPVVAKVSAVSVSPFITGGKGPNPLPIGSTFSINVSALDAEKLWGYQFQLSYNTTVLNATGYTVYAPFDEQEWPKGINDTVTTYLWVDAFDNTKKEWTPVGLPPGSTVSSTNVFYCLKAIDYPSWYIHATNDGANMSNFSFADLTSGLQAGGQVYIEIYANQSAAGAEADAVEIWLYNATSKGYNMVGTLTPSTGALNPVNPVMWKSIDVSPWLSNMTLINGAKARLVKKTNGAADKIEVDAMRLRVVSGYGYVSLAGSRVMGNREGKTGANVPLAKIDFHVESAGVSKLDIHDTKIADVDAHWADTKVTGLVEEDGYYGEIPLHDVAVTSVTAKPTSARPGDTVTIDVTVANLGEFNETFSVSTAYNLTVIDFKPTEPVENSNVTLSLDRGDNSTLSFTWDIPADFEEISCVVRGKIYLVTDMRPGNNEKNSGKITIKKTAYTPIIIYGVVAGVVIIIGAAVGISLIRRRKK